MKQKNCPNCGAPYDLWRVCCPYCNTPYLDLTFFDLDSADPIFLRFKANLNGTSVVITQKVKIVPGTSITLGSSSQNFYGDIGYQKIGNLVQDQSVDTVMSFKGVPFENGELMRMNYNANDIVSLSPGRAFRQKIGMYLSADRQEAINLGLRELVVNVQDEFEVYKPTDPLLKIELFTDSRTIRVSDNMRGIPSSIRDDGINSLTAAFLIPHSGGKHQEGVYVSSVGCNGEGNKVVCHTAKWLEVEVHRDGNKYFQRFESTDEGAAPLSDVKVTPEKNQKTGTIITYCPDPKVYGDIFIDVEQLRAMLREMSYFTKGLKIELFVDGTKELFYSKNGLVDGLNSEFAVGKPFSYSDKIDDCEVELALQWVGKKGEIKGYANGLYMPDGGVFISAFKTSLTRTFNSLAKQKFSGDQIRDCLNGFVSVKVHSGQFSNQAKTALANKEAGTATSSAITNCLKDFYNKRRADFDKIVEVLSKITKAEMAAERARQQVLNAVKDTENEKKKRIELADKLKDCKNHGSESGSVLAICEGETI